MGLKEATISGKQECSIFGLIHADIGVGKSTLAASMPAPYIFDAEESTSALDVDRCVPETYDELLETLCLFRDETHEYKTVIIDTIDHVEKMTVSAACKEHGVNSPADKSYGVVWQTADTKFKQLILGLKGLRARGFNVLLLAHSKTINYTHPLGQVYDKIIPDLRDKQKPSASTTGLIMSLPRFIGYMHRPILTTENKEASGFSKKYKATVAQNSVLSCAPHAAYEAKNDMGLEADIVIPKENGWAAVQAAVKQ